MMYRINQMMKQVRKKQIKSTRIFLTDDEKRLMVSSKSSNELKHNFPHHQQKLNSGLNIFHENNTKKLIISWLMTNQNRGMIMNSVQFFKEKFDYEYFNLMTPFLVSLVVSLVVS